MIENTPYDDSLDKYLLGKLSAEEQTAMDANFAADSQLQEDMLLQRDIVHALQEERRLELKSRLNSIEVGAGGFSSALGLKIAAGVALVSIVGTSLYLYLKEPAVQEQDQLPVGIIELPQDDRYLAYEVPAKPATPAAKSASSVSTSTADALAVNIDRAPATNRVTKQNAAKKTGLDVMPAASATTTEAKLLAISFPSCW